jgi:hypothetical protein
LLLTVHGVILQHLQVGLTVLFRLLDQRSILSPLSPIYTTFSMQFSCWISKFYNCFVGNTIHSKYNRISLIAHFYVALDHQIGICQVSMYRYVAKYAYYVILPSHLHNFFNAIFMLNFQILQLLCWLYFKIQLL